jgi:EamA domain-containing membrane protein RarD
MGVGSFIFNRFKASEFGAPTVLYEHDAYIISLDSTIQLFIMSSLMVSIIALVTFYLTNNNLRASYIGAVVYLSVGMFISTLILKGIKPAQYPWLLFIVLFVALAVIDEVLDRLVIRKLDIPRRY